MVYLRKRILALDDYYVVPLLGLFEYLLNIPFPRFVVVEDVLLGLYVVYREAFVVRKVRVYENFSLHRFEWIENGWKRFVFDLYELYRLHRYLRGIRCNGCHRFSYVPNPVRCEYRPVDEVYPLSVWTFFRGYHCPDTLELLGFRDVDLLYLRVWVRASQNGCVEHPGEEEVGDVLGGSRDLFVGVNPRHRLPDVLVPHDPAPIFWAAFLTALMMFS